MPSTPPYQSRLIPYQKEIFRMWYRERATLKVIQTWLSGKNIEITLSGLSGFIRRRKRKSDPHDAEAEPKRLQNDKDKALTVLEGLMRENNTRK